MVERWTNRATGTLSAGISSGALSLSLNSGEGALFPALVAGDHFWLKLEEGGTLYLPTTVEIVRCTARSVDTFTIVRAQQGTLAQAFGAGSRVSLRITQTTLESLRDGALERTPYARRIPSLAFVGAGATSEDRWGLWDGGAGSNTVTATLATTNQLTAQYHTNHASTAAAIGERGAVGDSFFRGGTVGIGGFRIEGKVGLETNNDGCRLFFGLANSPVAFVVAGGNPSAFAGAMIGFGFDSTSLAASGNLRLFHFDGGGGAPTDVDTGISRASIATSMMYFCIRADPAASGIRVVAWSIVAQVLFDSLITTNLPSATQSLQWQFGVLGNGAANSIRLSYQGCLAWPLPF